MADGFTNRAAPISFLKELRSYRMHFHPARRSAIAAERPAIPAPMMHAFGLSDIDAMTEGELLSPIATTLGWISKLVGFGNRVLYSCR